MNEQQLLDAARDGDEDAFARLIDPHRRELYAHCYRMLGLSADAEDALQDALLGAWRGLPRVRGPQLAALVAVHDRDQRLPAGDRAPTQARAADRLRPARRPARPAGSAAGRVGLDRAVGRLDARRTRRSPDARYEQREAVELAFIAALQHLPARQRAVLILRDVLGFSARETAEALDTTPVSVDSALQRAHKTVDARLPERSQQETLRSLDDRELRRIVDGFVAAWERADVDAIVAMLAEDAVLAMPPEPTWFAGRDAIARSSPRFRSPRRRPDTGSCRPGPTASSRSATTAGARSRTRSCPTRSPCCRCATRSSSQLTFFRSAEAFTGFDLPDRITP